MSSSISQLPDSATRLITSYVVIVTPALLVKELLDNAIDAKATSVEILVSSDTISRVEIRDNGVGIHPDDFDALGRRGHTSKLRSIRELGNIVGKSLGFRGEALASANSMADVTITTKTSTEPIATVFQLIPNKGGILTQRPASAPVGTTVSVTNLFSRQPVREQVAVREAKKTLDNIQELLRSYIMARPKLKILFKVLQAPTKVWSYSPKRNATAIEAALQLFGIEVASNCLLKTLKTGHTSTNGDSLAREISTPATDNFLLEVFLANPNVNLRKVPKHHYFSVDGRPISASRGVAKRLLKIYQDQLKRSTLVKEIGDCFIRINICCSPGSYDANIEPSKNNVLFSDEQIVLDAFGHLCSEIYKPASVAHQGTLDTADTPLNGVLTINSSGQAQLHRAHGSQDRPGIPDCARKIAQSFPQTSPEVSRRDTTRSIDQASIVEKSIVLQEPLKTQTLTSMPFTPINARNLPSCSQLKGFNGEQSGLPSALNQWKVDMLVDLNERPERSRQQRPPVAREPPCSQDTRTSEEHSTGDRLNPWANVKMSSSSEASPDAGLKYAPGSPMTPEPPVLRHIMAPPRDLDVPRSHQNIERTILPSLQRSTVPGGPYRSPMASPLNSKPPGVSVAPFDPSHTTRRHRRGENIPWTPPSSLEKTRYKDTSKFESTHLPCEEGLKQTQISFSGPQSSRRRSGTQGDVSQAQVRSGWSSGELETNSNLNMQDMFSTAKKNLHYQISQMEGDKGTEVVQNGGPQRHCQGPSRQRQPFTVLQTNTFRNSEAPQDDREPIATTLTIGDPRAYLLRRQKSMTAEGSGTKPKKLSRVKSSLMPLESTSPEYYIHVLSSTVSIGSPALNELVRWVRKYDEYIIYGTLVDGLEMNLFDGRAVESRLQKLLAEQKENIGYEDTGNDPVIIDLQAKLKGKSVLVETAI
ncbi:hypothetical protein E0Z10_g7728 [Xylaria hypoxylon]|uniref:DNA mismatch repair protein S5 domain-containing protein n=1 Tax=Xylaria hypoxylon TaxID=37992 RepID=A0A4Z0YU98_9PEZI|nr:hypothetical protein E0Z10_g7728 [Xylaria hypoxylon]